MSTTSPVTDQITSLVQQLAARDATIEALSGQLGMFAEAFGEVFAQLQVAEQFAVPEGTESRSSRELGNELVRMRERLRTAQTELVQAQKLQAIGSLAAGIAHEINTPTQFATDNAVFVGKAVAKLGEAVVHYQQLLEELIEGRAVQPKRAQAELAELVRPKFRFLLDESPMAVTATLEGLQRICSIVKAMKEFSHPSGGIKSPVDLGQLVTTTVTVARNEWKYVADVETSFEPNLPEVPCCRDELGQAILNLLVNAAHAIDANTDHGELGKGRIRIALRVAGEHVELSVSDTGCGMPESVLPRIFEPFFTTKPVGKGTGQGLAIVHSVVVEKHRGRLTVESKEGEGTTFRLFLPRAEALPAERGS